MTTTARMTAATGMTYVNTATASSAATISADASATNVATPIITVAAIVGTVDIPAVVKIAVAADHPAQHAGNHSADNRFGNDVCEAGFANCEPATLATPAKAGAVTNIIPTPTTAATRIRSI